MKNSNKFPISLLPQSAQAQYLLDLPFPTRALVEADKPLDPNTAGVKHLKQLEAIHYLSLFAFLLVIVALAYILKRHFIKFVSFFIIKKDFEKVAPLIRTSQSTQNILNEKYSKEELIKKFQQMSFKQKTAEYIRILKQNFILYHPLVHALSFKLQKLRDQSRRLPFQIMMGITLTILIMVLALSLVLSRVNSSLCERSLSLNLQAYLCTSGLETERLHQGAQLGLAFAVVSIGVTFGVAVTYFLSRNYLGFLNQLQKQSANSSFEHKDLPFLHNSNQKLGVITKIQEEFEEDAEEEEDQEQHQMTEVREDRDQISIEDNYNKVNISPTKKSPTKKKTHDSAKKNKENIIQTEGQAFHNQDFNSYRDSGSNYQTSQYMLGANYNMQANSEEALEPSSRRSLRPMLKQMDTQLSSSIPTLQNTGSQLLNFNSTTPLQQNTGYLNGLSYQNKLYQINEAEDEGAGFSPSKNINETEDEYQMQNQQEKQCYEINQEYGGVTLKRKKSGVDTTGLNSSIQRQNMSFNSQQSARAYDNSNINGKETKLYGTIKYKSRDQNIKKQDKIRNQAHSRQDKHKNSLEQDSKKLSNVYSQADLKTTMGRSQLSNYQSSFVRPRSHVKNSTKLPPVGSQSNFLNSAKSNCQSQAAFSDSTAPVVYPNTYLEDQNHSSINQDADISSKNLLPSIHQKPMLEDVEDLEDLDLEKQRSQRIVILNGQISSRQVKSKESARKLSGEQTPGRACHNQSSKEESKEDDSSRIMMMRAGVQESDNINSRESLILNKYNRSTKNSREIYFNLAILIVIMSSLILSSGFVVYSFYNMTRLGLQNALTIFGLSLVLDLFLVRPLIISVFSIISTIKEFKQPSEITLISFQNNSQGQMFEEEQLCLLGEIYEDYHTPIFMEGLYSNGNCDFQRSEEALRIKNSDLHKIQANNKPINFGPRDPSQKLNELNPLEHPDYHTNFDREGSPDQMHPSPHQSSPQPPFSLKPTPLNQEELIAPSNFTATPSKPQRNLNQNQSSKNNKNKSEKLYFDLSKQQTQMLNKKLQEKLLKAEENYYKNAKGQGNIKNPQRISEIMIVDQTYFYHQEQKSSGLQIQQLPFSAIKDQVNQMKIASTLNNVQTGSPTKNRFEIRPHSPQKKQIQRKDKKGEKVEVSETVQFDAKEEELRLRKAHLEKLRAENHNDEIDEIQMASASKKNKLEYVNPYVDQDQSDRKSLMLPPILQPQHQFETPKNPNQNRILFPYANQLNQMPNGVNSSQQIITFNELRDSKNESQFFLKDFIQGLSHSSKKQKALMIGGKDYNSLQKYLDEDKENLSHSQYNSSSKHNNLQGLESGGKNPLLNSVGAKTNSKGKIALGLRASLCGSQKRSKKYVDDPMQNIFSPPNFDARMDPQTLQVYNSNHDELIKFTPQYCSLNKSVKAQGLKQVSNKFSGNGTQKVRQSQGFPENFSDFRLDPYAEQEEKASLTKSQARPSIAAGLRASLNGKTLKSVKQSIHSPTSIKENLEERMNKINQNSIASVNRRSILMSQAPDYSPFQAKQLQHAPIIEANDETYLEAPTMNMPSPSRDFNLMQSIDFNNPFPHSSHKKSNQKQLKDQSPLKDITNEQINQDNDNSNNMIEQPSVLHHLPPIFKVNNQLDQSSSFLDMNQAYNVLASGSFNEKFPPRFRESTSSNLRQYLQPQYVQQKQLERQKNRASDKSQILSFKGNSTEGDVSLHQSTKDRNLKNLNKQTTNEFNIMTDGSGPITLQDLRRQNSEHTDTIPTVMTEETIDRREDRNEQDDLQMKSHLKQSRGPNSKGQVIRTEEDMQNQNIQVKQSSHQKKIQKTQNKNQALTTENFQMKSKDGDFKEFFVEEDPYQIKKPNQDIDLLKTLEEQQDRENDSIHRQNLNDISRNIYNRSENGNGGMYDDQLSRKSKIYEDSDTSTFKMVKLGGGGTKGSRKQTKTALNMRNADFIINADEMVSNQSVSHMLPPLPQTFVPPSTKAKDANKNMNISKDIQSEVASGPINFYSNQNVELNLECAQQINQDQNQQAQIEVKSNPVEIQNELMPKTDSTSQVHTQVQVEEKEQEQNKNQIEESEGRFMIMRRQQFTRDESKQSLDQMSHYTQQEEDLRANRKQARGNILQLSSQESLEGESDEDLEVQNRIFGQNFDKRGESNDAQTFEGRKGKFQRNQKQSLRDYSSTSQNQMKVGKRQKQQLSDSLYERGFSRDKNDHLSSRGVADFTQYKNFDDIGEHQRERDQTRKQLKEDQEIMQLRIQDQMRKLKNFLKLAQQLKSTKDEKKIKELINYLKTEQRPLPYSRINELKALEMMSSPYNQSLIDMIKDEYERFTKGQNKEGKNGKTKGEKQSKSQQRKQGQILNKLNGIYGQPIGSHSNNSFTQRKDAKRSESQESNIKQQVGSALNSSNLKKLVTSRAKNMSRDSSTSTINLNDTNLNNLSSAVPQNNPKFKKREISENRQTRNGNKDKSQERVGNKIGLKNFGAGQTIKIENFNSSDEDLESQTNSKTKVNKNRNGLFGDQGSKNSNILEIHDSIEFNDLEDYV